MSDNHLGNMAVVDGKALMPDRLDRANINSESCLQKFVMDFHTLVRSKKGRCLGGRGRGREIPPDRELQRQHGRARARTLDPTCLAHRASGLWLRYATLQNLIAPPNPPPWRNPRKRRDKILPSDNLEAGQHGETSKSKSAQPRCTTR